jgi:outer membrane protein assembly factor BamB
MKELMPFPFPALMVLLLCTGCSSRLAAENWPSFRGPQSSGQSPGAHPPERWDVESGENIAWKVAIPGLGHSSPVIWGDRVFITTSIPATGTPELRTGLYGDIESVDERGTHEWRVICLDRASGNVLWQRTAVDGVPRIKRHPKSSHANSTPATDGHHLVCLMGAEGLFCYGLDGNLLWEKDLGFLDSGFFAVPAAQWGFGSSPVIHEDRVIVQADVLQNSFIAAFDLTTGKERWRTPRQDVPTWSTPTLFTRGEETQIVVNGFQHAGGYDFATGAAIWQLTGNGDIPVPTPIVAHDLIFLTSAHGPMAPIHAVRTTARGNLDASLGAAPNPHIAWSHPRRGNYMQTPIVVGDLLYLCSDAGIVGCYRATTGEELYRERLGRGGGGFTASPVAVGKEIYYTSEHGEVFVVRAGPEFQVLRTHSLGEACMATPAIAGDTLLFRTQHHLIAIRETAPDQAQ